MTLSCYELQTPLEIGEGKTVTLVIENPVFYRNFVNDLLMQTKDLASRFMLFDGDKDLSLSKDAEIITDIFHISFDSRTLQNKVNQIVSEEYVASYADSTDILSRINEIGAELLSSLDFEANYTPLTDFNGIIKLLGFAVDIQGMSLPERIMEYTDFLNLHCGKRFFVILNLKSALTQSEFSEFAKMAEYKKISFLLIESHQTEICDERESIRIIDRDLCEI